jgi:hypothetical protein
LFLSTKATILKRLGTSSFKALATEIAFASVPKLLFLLTLYYFFSKVMFKHCFTQLHGKDSPQKENHINK